MATAGNRWAVVMSRNAGFSEQVIVICHLFLKGKSDELFRKKNYLDLVILFICIQVVELDFLYPSEGIHRRWDRGFRITATAATWDQAAFVLSVPRRKPMDETQETLRTSAFPSQHVKVREDFMCLKTIVMFFLANERSICFQEKWAKNLYIASVCYGRTVS